MSSYLLQRDSAQIGSVFWNCRSTTNVGCPGNKAGGISKAQLKTYKVGFCGKQLQLCWVGHALNSPESRIRSEICLSRATPLYPAFVMSPLLIYWQSYVRYDESFQKSNAGEQCWSWVTKNQYTMSSLLGNIVLKYIPCKPLVNFKESLPPCTHLQRPWSWWTGLVGVLPHTDIWPGVANGNRI